MAEALRYKDKVTIVTGGSSGIGRGCVEVFVQHGSKVVIASNAEGEGKQLETELNKKGPGEAFFIFCDVNKEDDIKNMINKTIERYGKLDCLVNNAGWRRGKIHERRARGSIFGLFAYKADMLPIEIPHLVFGFKKCGEGGCDRRYPHKFRYLVEE